nr:hypothetical protein [uncultured Treponema sp.]
MYRLSWGMDTASLAMNDGAAARSLSITKGNERIPEPSFLNF